VHDRRRDEFGGLHVVEIGGGCIPDTPLPAAAIE
jgi:hypothetical protein